MLIAHVHPWTARPACPPACREAGELRSDRDDVTVKIKTDLTARLFCRWGTHT